MSDCPRTVFRGPTPAGFAKKSPTFECRAAPSTARSGGGSRTPEECDFSTCRSALTESSALRPPPEAMQTPIGVPSGTAKAGDSQSRDELSPKLGHSFGRDLPMTADATPRRKAATFATLTCDSPLASTEKPQFKSNRAQRARESPPPRATLESWSLFCKGRWRRPENKLRMRFLLHTTASSAERHRAPPGVAVARATRRVAVVQLANQETAPPPSAAQRSLSARLGKSFPINSPFIGLISS
jgi:hypothetical protein